MALVYKSNGAWGTGTGAPLSAAQVDGNFYELAQRIGVIETSPDGVSIASIEQNGTVLTFTLTNGVTETFTIPTQAQTPSVPMQVATQNLALGFQYAGKYMRCTHVAGCTINLTTNDVEPFTIGQEVRFHQAGGPLSFTHDSGVTLNPPAGYQAATNAAHATVILKYVGNDEWDLSGGPLEPEASA